jgi:hypothetical protein
MSSEERKEKDMPVTVEGKDCAIFIVSRMVKADTEA